MKYQSVTELLDAQWAESWESLSEIRRGVWKEAAFPLYQWDNLSPEQRQSVAEQHDQRNDPANAEENSFWFDNASDISRIERDIQEIELQRTFAPSERAEKLRQLDDASQKLADLKSARFQPSTAPALAQNLPPKRGVTKAEILRMEWPMPAKAPSLDSILDKIPKWVSSACNKVGQAGKGVSGSHLWNPAVLAMCLASTTPQKRWRCNKLALTNLMRNNYSDYFNEWEDYAERL